MIADYTLADRFRISDRTVRLGGRVHFNGKALSTSSSRKYEKLHVVIFTSLKQTMAQLRVK